MVEQPHVQILAQRLQECLEQAQATNMAHINMAHKKEVTQKTI